MFRNRASWIQKFVLRLSWMSPKLSCLLRRNRNYYYTKHFGRSRPGGSVCFTPKLIQRQSPKKYKSLLDKYAMYRRLWSTVQRTIKYMQYYATKIPTCACCMHDDMQNKLSCVASAAHMPWKRRCLSAFLSMSWRWKRKVTSTHIHRVMENMVVREICSLACFTSLACCCDKLDQAMLTV